MSLTGTVGLCREAAMLRRSKIFIATIQKTATSSDRSDIDESPQVAEEFRCAARGTIGVPGTKSDYMSLLTELVAFFGRGGYKDYAPPELSRFAALP